MKEKNTTAGVTNPAPPMTAPTPPTPPTPPVTVKPKEDVVEVSKSTLEKLLNRVENLEKDNELLKEAADKEKIAKIARLKSGGKLVKTVNINVLNNKIVIGWSRVKDDVYFDEQGRLHEEQIIAVHYEDGEKKEMDYRAFSRLRTSLKGEVVAETKDNDGNTNLKVMLADGKEINIDIKFVN